MFFDLLDIGEAAPGMLLLVEIHLRTQVSLEDGEVSLFEAGDGHQVFQELDAPVAGVVLGLVLDVVATLAIPGTHADVLGDNVHAVRDTERSCQRWDEAVHQVPRVGVESIKAAHDALLEKKVSVS